MCEDAYTKLFLCTCVDLVTLLDIYDYESFRMLRLMRAYYGFSLLLVRDDFFTKHVHLVY